MATLVVRYEWGRRVFEVDAEEGGADLRAKAVPRSKAADRPRLDGPRLGRQPSTDEILGSVGRPEPVTRQVAAVFFGKEQVSERVYGPEELPMDEEGWCRVLHEREGVRSLTLNGETIWSCEPSAADKINDALDALEELRP